MGSGCPAGIHDRDSDTSLPREELPPPDDGLQGYLAASVALAQISGHIFEGMYSVPPRRGSTSQVNRLLRRTIADLYGELVRWRHEVPSHLRFTPNAQDQNNNPSVLRSIAFLDLRFQYAIICVTRPLLFRLVCTVRDGTFDSLSKESRTFITTYADSCSQSARLSLATLTFMHQHSLLNNVLWHDTFYILTTTMVLLLEYLRASSTTEAYRVVECISILRNLHPRGTGRIVLDSLSDLATFLGLDDLPPQSPPKEDTHATGELQLYELFSPTTSTVTSPAATGISSPEISMNGINAGQGQDSGQGSNEFAWMDQIVRMAYAEFGQP